MSNDAQQQLFLINSSNLWFSNYFWFAYILTFPFIFIQLFAIEYIFLVDYLRSKALFLFSFKFISLLKTLIPLFHYSRFRNETSTHAFWKRIRSTTIGWKQPQKRISRENGFPCCNISCQITQLPTFLDEVLWRPTGPEFKPCLVP